MDGEADKSELYDRQIRLWGESGQKALESVRLCALSSGAAITETLKNLILPGIGRVTIVDKKSMTQQDLGNNFFVSADSLGRQRGLVTRELLQELNPHVSVEHVDEDPQDLIASHLGFFDSFNFVLVSDLPLQSLFILDEYLYQKDIPLLIIKAYGLVGYARTIRKNHIVLNPRSDFGVVNLGFWRQIPSLSSLVDQIEVAMPTANDIDHSHFPWPILLVHASRIYESEHGNPPLTRKELEPIREILKKEMRKKDEANYLEAIKNAQQILPPSSLPSPTSTAFDGVEKTLSLDPSSDFWVVVKAIQLFSFENSSANGNPFLPITGVLPDMHSDSSNYIALQSIMRDQAAKDAGVVMGYVNQVLTEYGRNAGAISQSYVDEVCKHAHEMKLYCFRSLSTEHEPSTAILEEVMAEFFEEHEIQNFGLYIALRAVDHFFGLHRHYPGELDSQIETDVIELKNVAASILSSHNLPASLVSDDLIKEFCRYGCAEIHTVASFMGGLAAQEVVKLVTSLFQPVNNTFIYNGMAGTTSTFSL